MLGIDLGFQVLLQRVRRIGDLFGELPVRLGLSCFLFSFVWQWTDLFYTRNFLATSYRPLYSTELSTIVSRMSRYFSSDASKPIIVPVGRQQQLISIGVLVCCIPLVILYVFTQRTFVQSIAMSGSKE